jgi:hypothetical protein
MIQANRFSDNIVAGPVRYHFSQAMMQEVLFLEHGWTGDSLIFCHN